MPRGRPRKPDPIAWLNDPPEWIRQFPDNNLEGIHEFIRQETERLRLEEVHDAYAVGRIQANANRCREKEVRRLRISKEFADLIGRAMSARSVAAHIRRTEMKKPKPEFEVSERTLRLDVTEIRKLAEPHRPKK
jgi:hypothetical protein